MGSGGICDRISQVLGEVLAQHGIESEEGGQDGDDHSFLIALINGESHLVDLPSHLYERGAGYQWKKIANVTLLPEDFIIERI